MKQIRDAVEILKGYVENDSLFTDYEKNVLPVLLDLAEKVLAVEGKMPEKMTIFRSGDEEILFTHNDIRRRINETIYQCTLAIAGALLSEEEIESIIEDSCEDNGGCGVAINPEKCATAIHSAQMEKLGGE
jgi:hypothetical protein